MGNLPNLSDEIIDTSDSESMATAVLEREMAATSTYGMAACPCCEQCGVPLKSGTVLVCRSCGWYAGLGTYLEVDPDWEIEHAPTDTAKSHAQPSHVKVWLGLIPWWGWVLVASVLAVVAESVIARLTTPSGLGGLRTTWSLTQLVIGTILVVGCHLFNFVVQAAEDTDLGVMDVLLKPFNAWLRAFDRLPTRLWVVDGALVGLTAVIMSLAVIGAIPYDRLWDWGFTPPPKQDLMGAVMDRAKQIDEGGADNLEDAIGDFAGQAGVDGETAETKPSPPPKRNKIDCVILGYRVGNDGRLTQLILGTAQLGRLVYAGNVTPEFGDKEAGDLLQLLAAARSHQPFIPIGADAIWVKPAYTCRVTYVEQEPTGRLISIKWDTLLGTIRL